MRLNAKLAIAIMLIAVTQAHAEDKKNGCQVESVNLLCMENGEAHKVVLLGKDPAEAAQLTKLQQKYDDLNNKALEASRRNADLTAQLDQIKAEKAELSRKLRQLGTLLSEVTNPESSELTATTKAAAEETVAVPAPPEPSQALAAATRLPQKAALRVGQGALVSHGTELRSRPDKGASAVLKLKKGDKVEVLRDAGGGWFHVACKGQKGYLAQQAIGDAE